MFECLILCIMYNVHVQNDSQRYDFYCVWLASTSEKYPYQNGRVFSLIKFSQGDQPMIKASKNPKNL